jgi:hypothetical protein
MMAMIAVAWLQHPSGRGSTATPMVINTEAVEFAHPFEKWGDSSPQFGIRFRDGVSIVCQGDYETFRETLLRDH